jgi:parallel beta-helix repeat protein
MIPQAPRRSPVYTGTGVLADYDFTFRVYDTADVAVTVVSPGGTESVWAEGADYAVALNADQSSFPGGTITPLVALASGYQLVITGAAPYSQLVQFLAGGRYNASIHEMAIDLLAIQIQQLLEAMDRAVRFPVTDSGGGELPTQAERSLMFLAFDENGAPIAASGTATGDSQTMTFQQAGDGAVLRNIQSKGREIVTPEDFGAVGDGVTDDTSAFDAMDTYLLSVGGGEIRAKKSYNIPGGFNIGASNVLLDGCGTGEIHCAGLIDDAIKSESTENITVQNLAVYIPRANLRNPGKFCFLFNACDFVTVRGCRTDGGTVGIWTINCNDVLVEGNHINTTKADGIHFGHGSNRCKAIGNTIIDPGDDALSTSYYTGYDRPSDIVFANNVVQGGHWGFGAAAYSADRVTIVGNIFHNIALGGVVATVNEDGTACTNLVVSGNNISGSNLAEEQPNDYWDGTDPGLNIPVTSDAHKACIAVGGIDVLIEGNKIHNVSSFPGGDPRIGVYLGGGERISVSNNFLTSVNGDGIHCGIETLGELCIDRNTFENVVNVAIRCTTTVNTSLSICGNTQGYGAVGAEPYMIVLSGTGSVLAMINNNNSSGGRGIQSDNLNPQEIRYNNTAGKKSFAAFVPAVTAEAGALTAYTVNSAKYSIVEEIVHVQYDVTIPTNGTGATSLRFGLPATAAGRVFTLAGREDNLTGAMLQGVIEGGGSVISVRKYDNSYPGADNARIVISGFYEKA